MSNCRYTSIPLGAPGPFPVRGNSIATFTVNHNRPYRIRYISWRKFDKEMRPIDEPDLSSLFVLNIQIGYYEQLVIDHEVGIPACLIFDAEVLELATVLPGQDFRLIMRNANSFEIPWDVELHIAEAVNG